MADPLSIIGALAAVVQLSSTIAGFIKTAKDAKSDRLKLLCEINATSSLCQTLADSIELDAFTDSKQRSRTLQTLYAPGGPVEQFRTTLTFLEAKLAAGKGRSNFLQSFKWPFSKGDLTEIMVALERQKGLFTLALSNDSLRVTLAIHEDVRGLAHGVDSIRLQQKEQSQETRYLTDAISADQRRTKLSGLTSIDFQSMHRDISSRRAAGTGLWLLQHRLFQDWVRSEHGVLWCHGIPGSGKTTLASLVIDTFNAARGTAHPGAVGPALSWLTRCNGDTSVRAGVVGIYCTYRSAATIVSMLGSVVAQLAESIIDLPNSVCEASEKLDLASLKAAFADVSSHYDEIVIIVDALDECANRSGLLKELKSLCDAGTPYQIKIMVTSRTGIIDIERQLQANSTQIEVRSDEGDVRAFLHQSLRSHAHLSDWIKESPQFENDITETVVSRISGMFLLARLYMDILAQIPSKRGVRKALSSLPEGIEDTYREAWNRVLAQNSYQAAIGRRVLLWVTHSARPIRVSEVIFALAIEDGDEEMDEEGFLDATTLTSFCAGLVVIDERGEYLSLVHPTTQEFFNVTKAELLLDGHAEIASTCITYLQMRPFSTEGAITTPEAFKQRTSACCLLGYAAVFWGHHVREARSQQIHNESLAFLNNEIARLAAFQALTLNVSGVRDADAEWPEYGRLRLKGGRLAKFKASSMHVSALHLASFFGLQQDARKILESGANVNELDGGFGTAVHWAVLGGQNNMLEMLLKAGADPNLSRRRTQFRRWDMASGYSLALLIATWNENLTALRLLLEHGIESSASREEGENENTLQTALSTAIYAGKDASICLLLDNGANPNPSGDVMDYINIGGNVNVLKRLVSAGLNQDNLDRALLAMIRDAKAAEVDLLLRAGANPDAMYKSVGMTEVESLITRMHRGIGHRRVGHGRTALITSVEGWAINGNLMNLECFRLLIEAGTNVNHICPKHYDWELDSTALNDIRDQVISPVVKSAQFGLLEEIRLLAAKGADLNLVSTQQPLLLHPLEAALTGEDWRCGWDWQEDLTHKYNTTASLRSRDTVSLLIELGSSPELCSPEAQSRIHQLLNMSEPDCEKLVTFQSLIEQHARARFEIDQSHVMEVKQKLCILIDSGADISLCCQRDQEVIHQILSRKPATETEVEEFNFERAAVDTKSGLYIHSL